MQIFESMYTKMIPQEIIFFQFLINKIIMKGMRSNKIDKQEKIILKKNVQCCSFILPFLSTFAQLRPHDLFAITISGLHMQNWLGSYELIRKNWKDIICKIWHFALLWTWIPDEQIEISGKHLGIFSFTAAKRELLSLHL